MSMALHGLYRTFKSNYVPYFSDGYGRDRYIAFNNGGFFTNKKNFKDQSTEKTTGTTFYTSMIYKNRNASVKVPNFHYHSDGNGRDRYIVINGGGLFYDSKPLNSYRLTDFLRSGESYGTRNTKVNGKVCLSKSEYKYIQFLRKKEKDIINRLYNKEKKKFIKTIKGDLKNEDSQKTDKIMKTYTNLDNKLMESMPLISPKETYQNSLPNIEYQKTNLISHKKNKSINNTFVGKKPKITIKEESGGINPFLNGDKGSSSECDLFSSIGRINKYEANQALKKMSKKYRQPYLHLINNNPI